MILDREGFIAKVLLSTKVKPDYVDLKDFRCLLSATLCALHTASFRDDFLAGQRRQLGSI